MEFLIEYGYIGVFIASFLAATVLPFSSEVVLTGVLLAGSAYWPCMIAATLGNFLGGMSCYWLGMLGKVEWIEKYLKLDAAKLQKVQGWIKGKGSWMAFSSFCPVSVILLLWRSASSAPISGSWPFRCFSERRSDIGFGWNLSIKCRACSDYSTLIYTFVYTSLCRA